MQNAPQYTILVEPRLADIHEVARLYSLSERAVWRLHKRHELPAPINFGKCRTTRWRVEDLVAHIREMPQIVRPPIPSSRRSRKRG